MTDTTEAVEGRSERSVHRGKNGPMGPGNGPMIAAGIMLGGAILFTGWSVGTAMADEGIVQALGGGQSIEASADPAPDDEKSVTLPDEDGNGVPDEYEEAEPAEPVAPEPVPEPKPVVYLIEEGDTLTEISAETGVPVDMLVQTNGIQNPNLIFAGSSLLIPPV